MNYYQTTTNDRIIAKIDELNLSDKLIDSETLAESEVVHIDYANQLVKVNENQRIYTLTINELEKHFVKEKIIYCS